MTDTFSPLGGFFFRGTRFDVTEGKQVGSYPVIHVTLPGDVPEPYTILALTLQGDSPFTGPLPPNYWNGLHAALRAWFVGNLNRTPLIESITYMVGTEICIEYPPVNLHDE